MGFIIWRIIMMLISDCSWLFVILKFLNSLFFYCHLNIFSMNFHHRQTYRFGLFDFFILCYRLSSYWLFNACYFFWNCNLSLYMILHTTIRNLPLLKNKLILFHGLYFQCTFVSFLIFLGFFSSIFTFISFLLCPFFLPADLRGLFYAFTLFILWIILMLALFLNFFLGFFCIMISLASFLSYYLRLLILWVLFFPFFEIFLAYVAEMLTVFGISWVHKLLEQAQMRLGLLLWLRSPHLFLFSKEIIFLRLSWLVTGSQLVESFGDFIMSFGAELYFEIVEDTIFHVLLGSQCLLQ